MENYRSALFRFPKLAIASFLLTLVLQIVTHCIEKLVEHPSAFENAVALLFHYPESVKSIFAFFSAIIFLLCLTFFIEPSDLGRKFRKFVLIPSLHMTEHMLSLVIGVFVAWGLSEYYSIGNPVKSVFHFIGIILLSILITWILAAFCALLAEFLEGDFDRIISILGRWRFFILFAIAGVLIWAVLQDTIWNYNPGGNLLHK